MSTVRGYWRTLSVALFFSLWTGCSSPADTTSADDGTVDQAVRTSSPTDAEPTLPENPQPADPPEPDPEPGSAPPTADDERAAEADDAPDDAAAPVPADSSESTTPAPSEDIPEQPAAESSSESDATAASQTAPVDLGPPPADMPAVAMTDEHAAACLVEVGDAFPTATLVDLDGESVALASLYGPKLTVVVVWRASHPYAVAALRDMTNLIERPFAAEGVQVVGINVGDPGTTVQEVTDSGGIAYPQLLDEEETLYAQLATSLLPRIYLLDEAGRVVWLDVEYAVATQRHLRHAVRFMLSH